MHHKITSAFEHRRTITLSQVLASEHPVSSVYALCNSWGVEYREDLPETIFALARHAIEYDRQSRQDGNNA